MNTKRATLKKVTGISSIALALPSSWMQPVINTVLLPAHAQTSTCDVADLSGSWNVVVSLDAGGVFDSTTSLNSDGTGTYQNTPPTPADTGTVVWSVVNQVFSFLSTSAPSGVTADIQGIVDGSCSSITGTYVNSAAPSDTGTVVLTRL